MLSTMRDQLNIPLDFNGVKFPSMNYEPIGIKGVGKDRIPIITMDQYIDHSQDGELHLECCKGLAKCNLVTPGGMFYGGVPSFEQEKFNNKDSWDMMLRHIETYDPTNVHRLAIEELLNGTEDLEYKKTCVWRYAYYALGAIIPWFFVVYLKIGDFSNKTTDNNSKWSANAKHFPKVIKYVESLPFESIGRILFFTTYPNAPIVTHRDSVMKNHKDHNINLFFSSGDRRSYVYDPVTEKRVYLENNSRSYFFNNRDYHGVDAEPNFRYTLRVDGTFTKELQEKLKLENGYTWNWNYEK